MRLTIESTNDFADVNGLPCRVWTGTHESGARAIVFVVTIAVADDQNPDVFERELLELENVELDEPA